MDTDTDYCIYPTEGPGPLAEYPTGEPPLPTTIHRSTGNVFRDVGFSTEEAENLRIRGELMMEVAQSIEARKLTQPRVSDLVRGQIDRFSIDGLVNMLARLGMSVRLVVTRPRRAA